MFLVALLFFYVHWLHPSPGWHHLCLCPGQSQSSWYFSASWVALPDTATPCVCVCVCVCVWTVQSCPTLCDSMDRSPPSSSVHGLFQASILEWVAIPFSRRSSPPRDRTCISCIASRFLTIWATREAQCCPCPWHLLTMHLPHISHVSVSHSPKSSSHFPLSLE